MKSNIMMPYRYGWGTVNL